MLVGNAAAQATYTFSLPLTSSTSGPSSHIYDQLDVELSIGSFEFKDQVFLLPMTSADAGRTFSFSSGAGFNNAVKHLTDGIDSLIELIAWDPYGGTGIGSTESFWLYGDPTGAKGIDLLGQHVAQLDFSATRLRFEHPDGQTDVDAEFVISIHTVAIPEPGVWAMFGLGLALLGWRRESRR